MPVLDDKYIQRARQLAFLGQGAVSPNPMVGAVLVHQDRIIGEGWHQRYGQAHAEVNAVNSVADSDRHLIPESTLYCSLEPCCIVGNTPACTDLIIREKIGRVVIGGIDETAEVNGQGVALLRAAGVDVQLIKPEGYELQPHAYRNILMREKRPYIVLKWAQSADGFMGKAGEQVWLSNAYAKRLVHRWRAEASAILVGTQTAITDDPQLTNRLYFGSNPLRIVPDRKKRLPDHLHLLSDNRPTWVLGRETEAKWPSQIKGQAHIDNWHLLLSALVEAGKNLLLVEGGAAVLESFIQADLWDEARVIYCPQAIRHGISVPRINGAPVSTFQLDDNRIGIWKRKTDTTINSVEQKLQ